MDEKPILTTAKATLYELDRESARKIYSLEVDATNLTDVQSDKFWTNLKRFNSIVIHWESFHDSLTDLPMKPNYIQQAVFGIVHDRAEVSHKKLTIGGQYNVYSSTVTIIDYSAHACSVTLQH